ncbi:MAG: tRNA pseudouridine(13) synthase TruD [Planctomycetes bacterium]|nr:tRNA pseudouridine(13) synthase TruD [Planctomycetota bacterium]
MRYLTEDLPGTGGRIKVHPADFVVTEIPLYQPCGQGDHVYLYIEKQGLGSLEAADRIGRALGRPRAAVGIAGLKDAQAVTRQWMSLERVDAERAAKLHLPNIKILTVARHRNKLKIGHLAGNRFEVRVRGCRPGACERAERILAVLAARGVPNRFDYQRFGRRGDNHLLGRALVLGQYEEFCNQFLGRPSPRNDSPRLVHARQLYDAGSWHEAAGLFSGSLDHQRVLATLVRTRDPVRAAAALPKQLARLLVGALQSDIFNAILERRLDSLDRVEAGDLAYIHPSISPLPLRERGGGEGAAAPPALAPGEYTGGGRAGHAPAQRDSAGDAAAPPPALAPGEYTGGGRAGNAPAQHVPRGGAVFRVERPEDEQPRAARFEISPSGPIVAHKVTLASGRPGEIEHAVLAEKGIQPEDFQRVKALRLRGDRRPLRFPLADVAVEPAGDDITVRFTLPSGAYATVVLGEITKSEA